MLDANPWKGKAVSGVTGQKQTRVQVAEDVRTPTNEIMAIPRSQISFAPGLNQILEMHEAKYTDIKPTPATMSTSALNSRELYANAVDDGAQVINNQPLLCNP